MEILHRRRRRGGSGAARGRRRRFLRVAAWRVWAAALPPWGTARGGIDAGGGERRLGERRG